MNYLLHERHILSSIRCICEIKKGTNFKSFSLFTRNNVIQNIYLEKKSTFNVRKQLFFIPLRSLNNTGKSDYKRILSLAKPERWNLFGAVSLLIVSSAVSMAVPFSLGKVLDIIYSKNEDTQVIRKKLNNLCVVLISIFAVGALCNFGRIYLITTAGYRITQALRLKVFGSILKQEQGWFDKRQTGELINRLSADTQLVGHALSSNISDGLRSTFMVLAGSGMMIYMSPQLALVGFSVVPPVAAIAVAYGRFIRKISRQVQDNLAEATQVAEERIANIRTVKTFNKEASEVQAYQGKVDNILQLGYKESLARAIFYGMTGFSGNVIIISVLYYGGVMVSDEAITVGNLSAFLLYAAYIGVSVGGLTSFYSELNKSLGAASRLWELIDRQPIIPMYGGVIPRNQPEGRIMFKDIGFSYPSREDSMVLNGLNLEIIPGQTIAVVGQSGSGKSTLAALLLRLYDPGQGQILLDGVDIKELDPNWLRRNIGTVNQEPILFSGSIRENILYGAEGATDEDVWLAAKEANVLEFAEALPLGLDTPVGERGGLLSGGQRQRVAIARALLRRPKVLVLDEATSALDVRSEQLVRDALASASKGRTVLTIAHRLSTVLSADTIAVLQGGRVAQRGTYRDLLQAEGPFKELVRHQAFLPAT